MSNAEHWHEERPRPLISGCLLGLILLFLLVAAGVAIFIAVSAGNRPAPGVDVTAVESRLTLERDDGQRLVSVDRRSSPEVWYRVTLSEAPVGATLRLHCDWINPAGQVVHQNRYQTRVIDRQVWPTHARYRLGPKSPTGTWTVRLSLENRVLATTTLDVRDGEEDAEPALEIDGDTRGES